MNKGDEHWMALALQEAALAAEMGEVPVGAVIVRGEEEIGRAHNRRETDQDPLAHAEMLAIGTAARRIKSWRLSDCTMYVTLEPCAMCAGGLVNCRVGRLVFGAEDRKGGYCGSLGNLVQDPRMNHRAEVSSGVLAEESAALLRKFFAALRQ